MRPVRERLLAILCTLAIVAPAAAWAQTAGATLLGKVLDQSGGTLPFATVTIRNVATGVTTDVIAGEDGSYRAPNLQPGQYEVTATFDGFSPQLRNGLRLTVGSEVVADFRMQLGTLSEQIIVSGTSATVDTVSSAVKHNVSGQTIRELPLNGRDWTQLAALQPGVATVGSAGGTRSGNGMKMTVSGARPSENNYRLNGIGVNDYANTTPGNSLGTNLGVEAIAEFTVLTNTYSAEYGRTSGGVVNAITRSGTNAVSATAFEFHRNSALDSRNYFDRDADLPAFHRNQFGFAMGGPIAQNRTFWFADYEGLREFLGETTISTVPSAAARQGVLASGTVTVNPLIARALDLFPLPNGPLLGNGDTGQFFAVRDRKSRGDYGIVKIDHKLSEADSLSATYLVDDAEISQPDTFNNKLVEDQSRRYVAIAEHSHTFSSSVVNVVRAGFSRTESRSGIITDVYNPLLTDTSLGFIPGLPVGGISVPGLGNPGNGPGAVDYATLEFNSYQASEDLFMLKGAHSLKFGVNVEHMQNTFDTPNQTGGSFNFGTLADFLANRPFRFSALFTTSDTQRATRQPLVGAYAQDDIRLNAVTLNVGVRYEMMTIPTEVNGKVAMLKNLTDPEVTVGGAIHDSNPTLLNFSPRIGMAWDPTGDGRMAIRAGFGMFDVLPFLYLYETPLNRSLPLFLQGVTTAPPQGSFPGGAYDLLGVQNLRTSWVDPDPPRAYRRQWNVNVQRQFAGWTGEVGYIGSRGINLPLVERNMNTVMPTRDADGRWVFPSRATSQVLNPNFSAINTTVSWNADSWYHGLQTSLKRNIGDDLQMQASYTWSQSLDTGSSISSVSSGTGYESSFAVVTPLLPEINKGPSNYDLPHVFVGSVVWNSPTVGGPALARVLLSGWQVAGVFKAQSGYPFTVHVNGDRAGSKADTTGASLGQPVDVLDGPGCSTLTNSGNPDRYVKLECFAFPADGVLGNLGRNALRSPGLATLDLVFVRNVPTGGGMDAQVRLEMFNALNRANFATPATTLFDNRGVLTANAGQITSTRTSARQIQLGLKVTW